MALLIKLLTSVRRLASRHPRYTLAFTTGLCLVMASLSVVTLIQQWFDARHYAISNSENIATILQHDIEHIVDIYDISLTATAVQLQKPEVMALPPALRNAILFDAVSLDPAARLDLGTSFVLDKDGNVMLDAQRDPAPLLNLADREYFQFLRSHPQAGLHISGPLHSRFDAGLNVVVLSRRVNKPDGSFDGVVGIGIPLSFFTRLLSAVRLMPESSLTLLSNDGVFLSRVPFQINATAGRSSINAALASRMGETEKDNVISVSSSDHIKRLFTFSHLAHGSMVIVVGRATSEVFSGWWRRAAIIGILMVVFSAALQLISFLLMAELQTRRDGESRMRHLARTDSLTGVATRRVFDEVIAREFAIAQRSKRSMALLFLDVDHFKAFNDSYGHQKGDQALARIGAVLLAAIRYGSDTAARYGGEEFVLVLADTSESDAILVAERMRLAVEALRIPHKGSATGNLTISIGVASYDGTTSGDVSALIELADEWLYQAKLFGRNRVYSASFVSNPTGVPAAL